MILACVDCPDPDCYGVAHWCQHLVTERARGEWVESDEIMCPRCRRAFRVLDARMPDMAEFEYDPPPALEPGELW